MASSPPPHHTVIYNIVFTIPRTSSHLLLQVLNLPAQQSVLRHPSDGYFFTGPLFQRFKYHIAGKDVTAWPEQAKSAVKEALQKSYQGLEAFLSDAARQGKSTFVKEHVNWILDPVAETRFLQLPSPASNSNSHSNSAWPLTSSSLSSPFIVSPTSVTTATHDQRNETALPDQVLRKLKPTFLIRNPMLTFPSLLRTSIDNEGVEAVLEAEETQRWEMTFHWSRALYEFYVSHSGFISETGGDGDDDGDDGIKRRYNPVIVDADDILSPTFMARYASIIGLDPALIRYEWSAATPDEIQSLSKTEVRMKDTLLKSRGIVKGKTAEGLVLEDEIEKWKKEFGELLAGRIERCVRDSMEDYLWLWERRLQV